jgi:hypothetical protein
VLGLRDLTRADPLNLAEDAGSAPTSTRSGRVEGANDLSESATARGLPHNSGRAAVLALDAQFAGSKTVAS